MVSRRQRVAVFGGDGRFDKRSLPGCRVRTYKSSRNGGNGPAKRLKESLKAGCVDRVIILARWCGHSASDSIRRLCEKRGVPVEFR